MLWTTGFLGGSALSREEILELISPETAMPLGPGPNPEFRLALLGLFLFEVNVGVATGISGPSGRLCYGVQQFNDLIFSSSVDPGLGGEMK